MTAKHLNKRSAALAIREMQIQMTLKFHLTPVRIPKTKTQVTACAGEDVEQGKHSSTAAGLADLARLPGMFLSAGITNPRRHAWLYFTWILNIKFRSSRAL